MNYYLISISDASVYTCSEELWLDVLSLARKMDWEPEGTYIDIQMEIDDVWDERQNYDMNLFLICNSHMKSLEWDNSNYIDKSGQVVTESDAYNMYMALNGTDTDMNLLEFLKKNGFRIR